MALRPTRMAVKPTRPTPKPRPRHSRWEPTHVKTKTARHALSGAHEQDDHAHPPAR